jgi:hypothetical protein
MVYVSGIIIWVIAGAVIFPNKGLLLLTGIYTVINGVKTAINETNKIVTGVINKFNKSIEAAVQDAMIPFEEIMEQSGVNFSYAEFFKLAVAVGEDPRIGVEISPTEALTFFEFADEDGSGALDTPKEIQTAFALYKLQLVEEERVRLGITDADILRDAVIIFIVLSIVFMFIYLVVSMWATTGVFQTIVSSSLVLGAGQANAPEPKELSADDYASAAVSVAGAADKVRDNKKQR